jgi:hypothetical protein
LDGSIATNLLLGLVDSGCTGDYTAIPGNNYDFTFHKKYICMKIVNFVTMLDSCVNLLFQGSVSGQCNNRISTQFTRYCGYYLGLTMLGTLNQPICGKMMFMCFKVKILFYSNLF